MSHCTRFAQAEPQHLASYNSEFGSGFQTFSPSNLRMPMQISKSAVLSTQESC